MYLFPLTLSESFVFLQKGDRDKASQDYTQLVYSKQRRIERILKDDGISYP